MKTKFFSTCKDRLNNGIKPEDSPYILASLVLTAVFPWITIALFAIFLGCWAIIEMHEDSKPKISINVSI